MDALNSPEERLLALQMLETFSGLAVGKMVAERATLVMRMSEIEDWAIVAASHKTGWQPPSHQWFCPHLLTPPLTTSPAGSGRLAVYDLCNHQGEDILTVCMQTACAHVLLVACRGASERRAWASEGSCLPGHGAGASSACGGTACAAGLPRQAAQCPGCVLSLTEAATEAPLAGDIICLHAVVPRVPCSCF
jgi:hypothetical protein